MANHRKFIFGELMQLFFGFLSPFSACKLFLTFDTSLQKIDIETLLIDESYRTEKVGWRLWAVPGQRSTPFREEGRTSAVARLPKFRPNNKKKFIAKYLHRNIFGNNFWTKVRDSLYLDVTLFNGQKILKKTA
jgi:hypothetical protein